MTTDAPLDPLRTPAGGFAMVALDQRESLREMFPTRPDGGLVDDVVLSGFKRTAAAVLSPHASGILLDHPLGVQHGRPPEVDPGCGLILAADALHSVRGAGVESSSLDAAVDVDLVRAAGAVAVKFLVIWRRGDRSFAPAVEGFLALADRAGVASLVEGIVRPAAGATWSSAADRHEAVLEAATALAPGASVYKAEVPGYVPGDLSRVGEHARQLTAAVPGPWVVLSNGVQAADFPAAVTVACAGGASGFLAGRAIWSDTVAEPDPGTALRTRAVDRLLRLAGIVEGSRRPTLTTEGARP